MFASTTPNVFLPPLSEIVDNFAFLDEWEERYRYLIELGRLLPALDDSQKTESNRITGCASQIWVLTHAQLQADGRTIILRFNGDSDAHIVRGLLALTLAYYNGRTPQSILQNDAFDLFKQIGLADHITQQRANGLRALIERIRNDACKALAA